MSPQRENFDKWRKTVKGLSPDKRMINLRKHKNAYDEFFGKRHDYTLKDVRYTVKKLGLTRKEMLRLVKNNAKAWNTYMKKTDMDLHQWRKHIKDKKFTRAEAKKDLKKRTYARSQLRKEKRDTVCPNGKKYNFLTGKCVKNCKKGEERVANGKCLKKCKNGQDRNSNGRCQNVVVKKKTPSPKKKSPSLKKKSPILKKKSRSPKKKSPSLNKKSPSKKGSSLEKWRKDINNQIMTAGESMESITSNEKRFLDFQKEILYSTCPRGRALVMETGKCVHMKILRKNPKFVEIELETDASDKVQKQLDRTKVVSIGSNGSGLSLNKWRKKISKKRLTDSEMISDLKQYPKAWDQHMHQKRCASGKYRDLKTGKCLAFPPIVMTFVRLD